jgi:phage regulator Rha-like protein
MTQLHESVLDTYKEMVIKEHAGFRLTLKKHEVISPKGLFSIDMVQESLKDGDVVGTQVYNFFMTKEECQALAHGLTA